VTLGSGIFPGESTQMMHPKSRELQRQLGVGGVNDHPDDGKNRQRDVMASNTQAGRWAVSSSGYLRLRILNLI
jgi:hypothetical protein